MAPPAKKSSKPVFKTSSPFTETKWPQISHEDEEIIVELLCNLLAPLGAHRAAHLPPSKGKSAKRKRSTPTPDTAPPPPPDLKNHLLIGLNSVTRHLEARAAAKAPAALKEDDGEDAKTNSDKGQKEEEEEKGKDRPLSIVVLTHPQPALSPAHAHIPTLLHLSTLSSAPGTTSPRTRLVALPTSTDARLAGNLHIPRVGAVGIYEGAPGAKALEDYVLQHVGLTECPWVDEAMRAEWKGLNVVGGKTKGQQ